MRLVKLVYFPISLIICLSIIAKSTDYLDPSFEVGFLIGKKSIFSYYRFFLYIHMLSAPISILSGLFQFSFTKSRFHKAIGKIYVASVIFASLSGLFMAFYALGGFWSILNFSTLSLLWLLFTLIAFQAIQKGMIKKHQEFMIRSFILTNSAILLRIMSYFNNTYHFTDPINGYIVIGWISWIPFLIIFELILVEKNSSIHS